MTHRFYENNQGGKLNIWVNEQPSNLMPKANEEYSSHFFNDGALRAKNMKIIVEFYRPLGGMIQYGLLGAEYSDVNNVHFELRCLKSGRLEKKTSFVSLLNNYEYPKFGGNSEFVDVILKNVSASKSRKPSKGILDFNIMGTSDVGSSVAVFKILTSIIFNLVVSEKIPESFRDAVKASE